MTKEPIMDEIEKIIEKYQYQEFKEIVELLGKIYEFLDANEFRLELNGTKKQ